MPTASHADFATEPDAVAYGAKHVAGGLRLHDLRHAYATWPVSRGVPVNDVQKTLGYERASTILDRYTHASGDRDGRVRGAFADQLLTEPDEPDPENGGSPPAGGLLTCGNVLWAILGSNQ